MIGVGDRSRNFSDSEFRDRRTGHNPPPPQRLIDVLQRLRDVANRPIPIVSGHRCPESNQAVGGACHSRHIEGDAADIPEGLATRAQAEAAGASGIGLRGKWVVHVDVRPGPLTVWVY